MSGLKKCSVLIVLKLTVCVCHKPWRHVTVSRSVFSLLCGESVAASNPLLHAALRLPPSSPVDLWFDRGRQ